MTLTFFADGDPKGQPRTRAFKQHGKMVYWMPPNAKGWKQSVRVALLNAWNRKPMIGPVNVTINAFFPRPKAHYFAGKRAAILRPDAPTWHTSKPDRDNVDKAILDALTDAGLWADDCQVCAGQVTKRYADTKPGALIEITSL